MRTVHEIEQALYEMAPRDLAFSWDNVGQLLGDPKQIDKPFLDEKTNGLSYAAKYMKGSPYCWQITLSADECERSELAMDAVKRL